MIPIRRAVRSAAPGLLLLAAAACDPGPPPAPEFRETRAWSYLVTQVSFGPRFPGHRGHARQLDWLREQMRFAADTVILQPFTATGEGGKRLRWTNIVARFRPELEERILLIAHRDTRRRADGAVEPGERHRPVPGANVNASGVAVLVEMAQLFHQQPPPVGVDVLFADGDDQSDSAAFAGTRHFLASMPGYRPRYAVVLQAVADYEPRFAMDPASAAGPAGRMWALARRLELDSVFVAERGRPMPSQADVLSAAGIPTVVVRDGEYGPANLRWHSIDDNPQYLKRETLGAVGRVLAATLYSEPPDPER
ncbi:M28 family peptidase [Longimicrobium sp.]|uniref:M28 family peptidase n=1 Tax=Longimicrobium sp. TaxID=2029185 RepID=UPI002E359BD3|nr:M28 family peptidase [Longimicrobium sp.]HEX6039792.1 M28 family peptidase [Longimicrobium sp.]